MVTHEGQRNSTRVYGTGTAGLYILPVLTINRVKETCQNM